MATLISKSSKLKIAQKPGTAGIYTVTAQVKLHLNSDDIDLLRLGQKFVVSGSILASDDGFNGGDDLLARLNSQSFQGPSVPIDTGGRLLTFTKDVAASLLDEDSGIFQGNEDDVYVRFTLLWFPIPNSAMNWLVSSDDSAVLHGHAEFGGKFQ